MTSKSLSRRGFLRSALGAGVTLTAGGVALTSSGVAACLQAPPETAAKYALIIDTTKCVGCGACEKACHHRNQLPDNLSYIHILAQGAPENPTFVPVQCQHCADAPCQRVCPAKATYHLDNGVVAIKEKKCVGCRYCELACPYQARVFDEERGVADKCWLCMDLIDEGKDPACVTACVFGARIFGLQGDPESEAARLIASGVAQQFHPEFGTEPSILYYIM